MKTRLYNETLQSLYRSHNIVRLIKSKRWTGYVTGMEEGRSAFKILARKLIGNKSLGRPSGRWEHNIRMDLKEIIIKTKNWIDSAQDMDYWIALVNAALNLRFPYSLRWLESLMTEC